MTDSTTSRVKPCSRSACTIAAQRMTGAAAAVSIALALTLASDAAAGQPTAAQQSAIRSACRGDYPHVCSGVEPGGAPALHCLQQNAGSVSAACQHALAAVTAAPAPSAQAAGASMASSPGTAPAMAPAAVSAPSEGAVSMRDEMRLMRESCSGDYRRFCQGVQAGGGHAITCLESNAAALSAGCRQALVEMKAHR